MAEDFETYLRKFARGSDGHLPVTVTLLFDHNVVLHIAAKTEEVGPVNASVNGNQVTLQPKQPSRR
jgi:hypothetical protein